MASEIYSESHIGTVLKVDKTNRKLGVYIPKLMSGIEGGEAFKYAVPTNGGLNISNISTNISAIVNKINYIWVSPIDFDEPLPDIGSKVLIDFIDNNPNLGYWSKFNVNNDYKVIAEEKYPHLYTLNLGQKKYVISEEDQVSIILPEYFDVVELPENNKQKIFKINENFNFKYGLEESIQKLQKTVEFLEKDYEKTFISSINQIKPIFEETELSLKLKDLFSKCRANGITKIIDSDDLLNSNDEFKYYSVLLNGLSRTYTEFLDYYQKFTDADKTLVGNLTDELITNKIINIFNRSENIATKENVQDYVEYITDLFSPIATLRYNYTNTDGENTVSEVQVPIFTVLGENPNIPANTDQMIPTVISTVNNASIDKGKYKFYCWKDENNIIVDSSYNALYDINIYAKFYGLFFAIENDTPYLHILNDTDLSVTSISVILTTKTNGISDKPVTYDDINLFNAKMHEIYLHNKQNASQKIEIVKINSNLKMSNGDTLNLIVPE